MKTNLIIRIGLITGWVAFSTLHSAAALTIPGADGSDGPFNPTVNTNIDLSAAVTGAWDANNAANTGKGVYDGNKWAVVFKYSSVNIPAGVTVTFRNHDSRAPVVWLVSGDVRIDGTVNLNGLSFSAGGESGPGGFRGGVPGDGLSRGGSAGFGPGGGFRGGDPGVNYSAGSYSTVGGQNNSLSIYGNTRILPLLGGSGSGAHATIDSRYGGGGGGGAILIAAAGQTIINGLITANGGIGGPNAGGGGAGGSGGAIRIVSESVGGTGQLTAHYTYSNDNNSRGGNGRIRIEANNVSGSLFAYPETSFYNPVPVTLWPAETSPSARIVSVAGIQAPNDPRARFNLPGADVNFQTGAPVEVVVETRNLPTTAVVKARIVPIHGAAISLPLTLASGNATVATWTNSIGLPEGFTAIQARATLQ